MSDLSVTMVPVDSITPYENNPRQHSDKQIAQIAASIEEFGFTNPILTHKGTIIAGHGRLLAAKQLGYTEVPTIDRSDLTEDQWRAYVIADNRIAEASEWDTELLVSEIQDLPEFDFDIFGIDDAFLEDLLGDIEPEVQEGLTDPDAVPEPPADPITQPGDLWLLGAYYQCEDCGKEYEYDTGKEMTECPCG